MTTKRPKAKNSRKKAKKAAKKLSKYEKLERYAAALERRLQKYERRRFVGPLRPGQKRKKPPASELEAIRTQLRVFLEGAKRGLGEAQLAGTYRSHVNADYSIDAEIRVDVETEGDFENNMVELEDAASWNTLGKFWVMIGLKVEADDLTGSPTIDRRPYRPWTNPVRGNRAGAAFFTATETVKPKLEAYGARVTQIAIRIHWSPDNQRPYRPRR
jgi:hypothetical protein